MNSKIQIFKYVLADWFSAALTWVFFFSFRKIYLESKVEQFAEIEFNDRFYFGLMLIPLGWLFFYGITGTYYNIYRKSRLKEMGQTLLQTTIGVIVVFFVLLLDDQLSSYKNYYVSISALFFAHFITTFSFRFLLSSQTAYKIHNRILGFNTLLLGSNEKAHDLFNELEAQNNSSGFKFVGYLHINGKDGHIMKPYLPHLGHVNNLNQILEENEIEEVIIAAESSEHGKLGRILNALKDRNVNVNIIPDVYDILSGSVKMTSIFGAPLIQINHEIMPAWQVAVKRAMDVVISSVALLLLTPLLLAIAVAVKLSSKGPVFFHQERVGRWGVPFMIHKFRSMYVGSERNGPQLSSDHDPRITVVGRFLRKSRLDELPQFFNVLIGEMSLVGPRPERQHYIDLISERAAHYHHLHKVRPGITSWGQVKYGYAENVEEMVQRLRFDLIYMENMSLALDIKILTYTVWIVLRGRGK